ncbi:hypothetical protein DFR58_101118 [Anaerobacterium chartisolvens]|uniref:Replication-associated protein ORF2/G2P domain-containing protein n=1 Tax=Anaerobacterium chartisolvens TaxID=1297424 RepID=A0A369BK17_9FIRM|nr:hypothetical protein [Anaerobacterium chartisolvens]RCX20916.1 hypothetical protein DFR58_101118 [Anaerobacterium chartisolvens]
MPYREKRIYSGQMLEVEIYPISPKQKKQPRGKKEKASTLKQKNLNDKNAKKHLIRLINTNFTDKDLAVHLTYTSEELPRSEEEARKDIANYIRRVKHYRKKNNLPSLKYIAVFEYKEKASGGREGKEPPVRMHHHVIMSSMDRDAAEQLWGKGRANADRLKADEYGYEGLARYITKDPQGSKRWVQSKNLDQPTVKINNHKYSKRKVEVLARTPDDRQLFERLYPGYILNDCISQVNDITAGTHLYIRMRKLQI